MLYNLEKIARDYINFTTEELFLLAGIFNPLPIREDKFVIVKGQSISDIYFLNSGIVKSYMEKGNEEFNVQFHFGPVFLSELNAPIHQRGSLCTYVVVDEGNMFVAKFETIKNLIIQSQKYRYFFSMIFKDPNLVI